VTAPGLGYLAFGLAAMFYSTSATASKSFEILITSTGTRPRDWRRWWAAESERTGTNWKSLLTAADAALSRLRAIHGASS
jgi:hypothetical protein